MQFRGESKDGAVYNHTSDCRESRTREKFSTENFYSRKIPRKVTKLRSNFGLLSITVKCATLGVADSTQIIEENSCK